MINGKEVTIKMRYKEDKFDDNINKEAYFYSKVFNNDHFRVPKYINFF